VAAQLRVHHVRWSDPAAEGQPPPKIGPQLDEICDFVASSSSTSAAAAAASSSPPGRGGAVLISCARGDDRSAAAACAVLMRRHGWGLTQAAERLAQRRRVSTSSASPAEQPSASVAATLMCGSFQAELRGRLPRATSGAAREQIGRGGVGKGMSSLVLLADWHAPLSGRLCGRKLREPRAARAEAAGGWAAHRWGAAAGGGWVWRQRRGCGQGRTRSRASCRWGQRWAQRRRHGGDGGGAEGCGG
jgi:hypothetical protein